MVFLLSQTGQPLKVNPVTMETEDILEGVNEGEDEQDVCFEEDQTLDLTVSSPFTDPYFSASFLTAASSQEKAVLSACYLLPD